MSLYAHWRHRRGRYTRTEREFGLPVHAGTDSPHPAGQGRYLGCVVPPGTLATCWTAITPGGTRYYRSTREYAERTLRVLASVQSAAEHLEATSRR